MKKLTEEMGLSDQRAILDRMKDLKECNPKGVHACREPMDRAHQAPLPTVFSGKNTGVGCHAPLQGILPMQGLNPHLLCLLPWQADSLPLVTTGKPHLKGNWYQQLENF